MTSTYTPNKNLAEPALGDTNWNTPLNSNFSILDSSLGGFVGFTLSSSNVTLSTSDIQNLRISVSGALLANVSVIFPSGVGGSWIISNFTTGNYTVTLRTSAVGGATVSTANKYGFFLVYSDGTNIFLVENSIPPGTIQAYGGTTAPYGWLTCNGASVSTTTYSVLFSAIGYAWGGSGANFNVPDLQNMFLRGAGSSPVGTYEADSFASHNHGVNDPGHTHSTPQSTYLFAGGPHFSGNGFAQTRDNTLTNTTGISIQNTGGSETRPVNKRVLYIIKT